MNLNIIEQIRELRKLLKRKPVQMVEKPKTETVIKVSKPAKRIKPEVKVNIEGKELTLKEIADRYNLKLDTVEARYRVGNRGKLLIRPVNRKKPT